MDFYSIASFMLTLAILLAYLNHRFIRMQTTIAIMTASMVMSLILILLSNLGVYNFEQKIIDTLIKIDFEKLLMNGMLSFLLFAGALTIDIHTLRDQKWEIFTLASFSTIASAFLVGIGTYYALPLLHLHLDFIYCMLFGALISPTDPIAVLATFKQLKAPKILDTTVAGESLFNDGVGIVMFLTLYHIAFSKVEFSSSSIILLFIQQAFGGMVYGAFLGFVGSWLIKRSDDHKIEILLTIAIATGGYAFAQVLNVSGALAMVVAGIIIGSYARKNAMSAAANEILDEFWELIDEILNSVLFLLIGFELLIVSRNNSYVIASIMAIPLVLLARYITVLFPMGIFKIWRSYCPYMVSTLIWGGLRGGLAVALALTIPAGEHRDLILAMTYGVVAFAVIVQGLTIRPLINLTKT